MERKALVFKIKRVIKCVFHEGKSFGLKDKIAIKEIWEYRKNDEKVCTELWEEGHYSGEAVLKCWNSGKKCRL